MQVMKKEWPRLAIAGVESFFGLLPPPQVGPAAGSSGGIPVPGPPPPAPPPPSFLDQCREYAASSNYTAVAYKARPLTGVWATGPFLHNGSVPTLYDLLLPPARRPMTFNLGTRRFDPVHVGFVATPAPDNPFVFQVKAADGSDVQGNSNQGHDYGNASLSEHQRLALVEYLKIIGE